MTPTDARQWQPLTSPSVWTNDRGRVRPEREAREGGGSLPFPFAFPLTGQLAPPSPPAPAPAPLSPAPAPSPRPEDTIRIGPDGRIQGVDGMLDQIAQALARHAGPMLARDVLPIVQRDQALQMRVGQSAGAAMADRLRDDAALQTRVGQAAGTVMADSIKPWVVAGASALVIVAAIQGYRLYTSTRTRARDAR